MRVLERDRATRAYRSSDGIRALRLDAHDANSGSRRAQRQCDPADEPAAADRDDHELDIRKVFDYFQADRALTRDDQRIGVGVHEGLALLVLDPMRERERVVVHVSLEQHLGAIGAAHTHDRVRHASRHHHRRRRAEGRGGIRDTLGVATRGRRDHAAIARGAVQRRDLVQGAADLERSRRFERLDLEMDVGVKVAR